MNNIHIKLKENNLKLVSLPNLSNMKSCIKDNSLVLKLVQDLAKTKYKYPQSFKPKIKASIHSNFSKSLKISPRYILQNFHWQNQWKNFHLHYKSLAIRKIISSYFVKKKLVLNNFYLHKFHGGLHIRGNTFGFYVPKFSKLFKKYKWHRLKFKKFFNNSKNKNLKKKNFRSFKVKPNKIIFTKQSKVLKDYLEEKLSKNKFNLLAKAIIDYTTTTYLSISFTNYYLPRTYIVDESNSVFGRNKSMRNFWEGLQIIRLIVENKAITHVLARFVHNSIRRNPKRAAFIIYIKRIIDWHFANTTNLQIQGIRIEVKGRFNAKSRSKKYILSVGRVAKEEKTSNVDYAFIEAFTIFGSLAIKVWVCPYI